jgi:bifunctional non-homologous end joining protein LigD
LSLAEYRKKRQFHGTPEPRGTRHGRKGALRFVVQKHHARRVHYDFRLELDGVLKSWAVPKGMSLDPADKRLGIMVEDHPIEYRTFEGVIPEGNYGAGTVMVWDEGTYVVPESNDPTEVAVEMRKRLEQGRLHFVLDGMRLRGDFSLVKLARGKNEWLLIKKHDRFASTEAPTGEDRSVLSHRTMDEIAATAMGEGRVWHSHAKPVAPKRTIARMPQNLKPMLATPVDEPFDEAGWIFEIKFEGYRTIAEVKDGQARLRPQKASSAKDQFAAIVSALERFGHDVVLDGELVVLDARGKPDFQLLQTYPKDGGRLVYYVFDLLYIDGQDLRKLLLRRRKELLKTIVRGNAAVVYSDHVEEKGRAFSKSAAEQGLKAIIGKRADSTYEAGRRSRDWVSIPTSGRRGRPLSPVQRARKMHSTFAAGEGGRREGMPRLRLKKEAVPFGLTNLDKVFFPEDGYTKGDVIAYYQHVAAFMLPHLRDRPISMNRHPNGIHGQSFFQKDVTDRPPPNFVETIDLPTEGSHRDRGTIRYMLCQNDATLLYLAQLGCIEINCWNSRVGHVNQPDYLVIDLDPIDVPFPQVVETAQAVRKLLDKGRTECFCKTSGKRGLHIYVPLAAAYEYEQVRGFGEIIARLVNLRLPSFTSLNRDPARRQGRVYLDFLQNSRGQTMAAAYSVRPVPGAMVSTPLAWQEVNKNLDPARFTIHTVLPRLEKIGDIWKKLPSAGANMLDCLESLKSNK